MEHQDRLGRRLQIRKIKTRLRFPSLFSRLVCIYISILAIMLIVLFMAFTKSFHSYFVKYTQEMMLNQAESISAEFQKVEAYGKPKEQALAEILPRIEMMNTFLEATSWIVDEHGDGYVIERGGTSDFRDGELLGDVLGKVFEGKIVEFEERFNETFSIPVLTMGYPIMSDDHIQYALFLHTPMPYILQTINAVQNLILNVVGFIGSIVFIWIYTLSKQMAKPLKEMNQVAKSIASGEFGKRIEVKGNDEIAQLGLSLNHMAEALDKIEEDRRSFIANISHDLRSPLTSIQGFVTAILDGTIDADNQEHYLKIVLSESKRLIAMSNAILELNQMQEGRKIIEKIPLNINQIIEEVVCSFENRSKEKNVRIIKQLDEKYYWILGDMDGVSRVLQNLMDNAFKFVGENGHILIRTQCYQEKLWISVLNDGPAILPEQQKLIWDRFYKGDRSRGQDKKGVGLGLVIVKEIIKQHDEVINVYSKEGEMVEFRFSMTLAD